MLQVSETLSQEQLLSGRCKNCNLRAKAKGKDWCQRCIDIFNRQQQRKSDTESLVRVIGSHVSEDYLSADVGDFDKQKTVLSNWDGSQNLYFYGDTGTGKTRAMFALLKNCIATGFSCRIIEFNAICSEIHETYRNNSTTSERTIIKNLTDLDILFIDDVGLQSSPVTDHKYQVFYRLIDTRLKAKLATVISSNKSPGQVGELFDARIASRLQLFEIVEFNGADKRRVDR